MFIGHFGFGYGAKSVAPKTSLGTLFLAAQFLDLLWPTLLLLGIERVEIRPDMTRSNPLDFVSYPISHSLVMVCVWSVLFASAYWYLRRSTKAAVVIGVCVLSHWLLDLIVHRPDLGRFALAYSCERILSDFNIAKGRLLGIGLVIMGCAPRITASLRRLRASSLERNRSLPEDDFIAHPIGSVLLALGEEDGPRKAHGRERMGQEKRRTFGKQLPGEVLRCGVCGTIGAARSCTWAPDLTGGCA